MLCKYTTNAVPPLLFTSTSVGCPTSLAMDETSKLQLPCFEQMNRPKFLEPVQDRLSTWTFVTQFALSVVGRQISSSGFSGTYHASYRATNRDTSQEQNGRNRLGENCIQHSVRTRASRWTDGLVFGSSMQSKLRQANRCDGETATGQREVVSPVERWARAQDEQVQTASAPARAARTPISINLTPR